MAMGIVSPSDFDNELDKSKSKSDRVKNEAEITGVINDVNRGRGTGSVEVPNTLRKIIGEESTINGRQSGVELAKSFGLSPSSVSAYANGATSTATYEDTPNKSHLNQSRERVSKSARKRLMSALRHITDDKLQEAKAKDLAGVAKDMAAVIKVMEPDTGSGHANINNNGPTFVFYSPQFRSEDAFDVVYAKE